jgi:hypothetical protein
MIKPSCSKARRLVLESEGGRIESADALWLETHIQECVTCRQESREVATLLSAWRSLAPPRLSASQLERIERAVLEADVAPLAERRPERTWKVPTLAAGVAAVVALASLATLWAKRQPALAPSPATPITTALALPPQTATVTHGSLQVYGPTGDARVVRRGAAAPWNTTLHGAVGAGCVLTVGRHATLGLTPGARVALSRHGADTVVAVTGGTVALDVRTPGTQGAGRVRLWIPGRGEVSTQDARLVVARSATGVAVTSLRGWARYRWTQGGTPHLADLEAGQRLTHRLDTVTHRAGVPELDAGALLAGRAGPARRTRHRVTGAPRDASRDHRAAVASRAACDAARIRKSLSRRDPMRALRALEACRPAGPDAKTLRELEARANLQAGRVRRAYNQYLAVAHSYQGSETGQAALYSAGRIALNRLAHRSQAKRLLQHYLHTYPRGAHRANVQQLLRTL